MAIILAILVVVVAIVVVTLAAMSAIADKLDCITIVKHLLTSGSIINGSNRGGTRARIRARTRQQLLVVG